MKNDLHFYIKIKISFSKSLKFPTSFGTNYFQPTTRSSTACFKKFKSELKVLLEQSVTVLTVINGVINEEGVSFRVAEATVN